MNNHFLLFFISLLMISINAHACLHDHDLMMARGRDKIIKENFQNGRCITPSSKFTEVNDQFKELTTHFYYDTNLRHFYARFLLSNNDLVQGLHEFAQVVISRTSTTQQTLEFIDWLKTISIEGESLQPFIDDINEGIMEPVKFAQRKKLDHGIKVNTESGLKTLNARITKCQQENASTLLALLKKLPTLACYKSMLNILLATLDSHKHSAVASQIVGQIFLQDGADASPLLKQNYAFRCLIKEGKSERAIPLYESILGTDLDPDNPYQTSINYNSLAICYLQNVDLSLKQNKEGDEEFECSPTDLLQLQKAATCLEAAIVLDDDQNPTLVKNLSCVQTWLNQFEQAYINFKQVMQTPDEKLAQFKINRKALDRQHLFILQKLGKTEQVTEILLKQQEIIATQSRKIAELIKEAHAEHEKELELKRRKAQEREARQEQLAQTKASNAQSAQFEEEIPLSFEGKEDKETNVEPVKKEKKKTRGKTKPTAPKSTLEKPKPKSLIHIDMLTENKNAHKTFEKLFGKYELGINSDSNVKISVNEIGCFFEALGQDYDPSGGHGSHKKATLNFQEFGSEADEKVIILTNKTYLKPEQIKNIRLAFVNARIVPNDPDIIGRLRQEGLL